MKVVLYTNSISAHQLPLAREIVKRVGADNFRYIYTGDKLQGGGQEVAASEPWITQEADWLETCDLLLSGNRDLELFQKRSAKGLKTYYQSERWFKPIPIRLPIPHFFTFHFYFLLPGALRLLHPRYRKMAKSFVHWLNTDPNARYLAIGPWAKKDMLSLGVHPDKIHDWGYFVEKGVGSREQGVGRDGQPLKVLYVGRLLALKHVDTIIRAVAEVAKRGKPITCTIVGSGPEEVRLKKLANSIVNLHLLSRPNSLFTFLPPVPISEVRSSMRQHDVLVFASDANDGWGAVVNEALSEGVPVIGTYETGAPAALLPDSQLFHCGDWRALAKKLSAPQLRLVPTTVPLGYTAKGAAEWLLNA